MYREITSLFSPFFVFLLLENIIYIYIYLLKVVASEMCTLVWDGRSEELRRKNIEEDPEDVCHSGLTAYGKHRISYRDSHHFTAHATKI